MTHHPPESRRTRSFSVLAGSLAISAINGAAFAQQCDTPPYPATEWASASAGDAGFLSLDANTDGATDLLAISGSGFQVLFGDGRGGFSEGVLHASGLGARKADGGDLNGDGVVDVAAIGQSPNRLVIVLSVGSDAYADAVEFPLGEIPLEVAVGDLDNDGDTDVLLSAATPGGAGPTGLFLYRNDGAGGLARVNTPQLNGFTEFLDLVDFDGDGDLDAVGIVTTFSFQRGVQIYENPGDGQMIERGFYPEIDQVDPIAVSDFDGDGDPDIAGFSGDGVQILRNEGGLSFIAGGEAASVTVNPVGLAAGDFNADGSVDLAITDSSRERVTLLPNDGSGSFGSEIRTFPSGGDPVGALAADVNGDGADDLLHPTRGYGVEKGFAVFLSGIDGALDLPRLFPSADGSTLNRPVLADIDADGDLDVVTTSRSVDALFVIPNNGDGTFAVPRSFAGRRSFYEPVIADLNNDGLPDVITEVTEIGVAVMLNLGNGQFAEPVIEDAFNAARRVSVADFNNDSFLDLAVEYTPGGGRVALLINEGDGSFTPGWDGVGGSVLPGDFNNDGLIDLAVGTGSGVAIVLNEGDAVFPIVPPPFPLGSGTNRSLAIDLDLDGDLDFCGASFSDDRVSVILNRGDGSFGPPTFHPVAIRPVALAAGDLNGDGFPEIVTANTFTDNVSILFSLGSGAFAPETSLPGVANTISAVLTDLENDGDLDILLPAASAEGAGVLLNRGDGTFDTRTRHGGTHAGALAVGDLDDDGDLDLVSAASDDQIAVLLFRGTGGCACGQADLAEPLGVLDLADIVAFVTAFSALDPSADFDGNGLLDLADITAFIGGFTTGCP